MPCPALAIVRRGEQPIHHLLEHLGRIVADECLDLFPRWHQTGEIERGAANERELVGGSGRASGFFVELGEEEGIDRVLRPGGILALGGKLIKVLFIQGRKHGIGQLLHFGPDVFGLLVPRRDEPDDADWVFEREHCGHGVAFERTLVFQRRHTPRVQVIEGVPSPHHFADGAPKHRR